ncbi:MAG: AraC family transcriptional regulator [Bacteroidota bacterium]|nr:AraC family transcriptional regulator [Bacteroidota bacterium]MDP4196726.1 AraC family transcriptional regulator [Bacteroidota bacterium]
MGIIRKKEGFNDQKAIVLPYSVIHILEKDPITAPIHITDIGYYPKAQYHFRERKHGCKQNILIYCVEGKGWFKFKNKKCNVSAQDYFLIPADTPHSYGADVKNPWTIYWIHFKGNVSSQVSEKLVGINRMSPANSEIAAYRLQLFEEIYQSLEKGYTKNNLQYSSMCLWYFLCSFLHADHFKQFSYVLKKDIVDQIIDFMQSNLSKNFSLKELSNAFGYSASHFSYMFKNKTGYAPLEFFSRLKIQRSCQYLDSTDLHIKEIASLHGYDDPYYFSRVFRKVMDVSPNEYRVKQKG